MTSGKLLPHTDYENFIRRTTHTSVTENLKHESCNNQVGSINYPSKNDVKPPKVNMPAKGQRTMTKI